MHLLSRSPKVLAAEALGQSILLDTDTWTYLTLNRTGTWVWEQFAQPRSTAWLIDAATAHFAGSPEEIRVDIEAFVADMLARKFVIQ